MKTYCISYKAPDYRLTGFLNGTNIMADNMIEALQIFYKLHPNCEVIGLLQQD